MTVTNSGTVVVSASIGTITSNNLNITVYQGLAPPSNFAQSTATSSSITVSWSSESGASSYNLYQNGYKITNTSGTSYICSGLNSGTSYTLAICAIDQYGNAGSSTSIAGYTLTATPTVSIGLVSGSSIQVSWTALYGAQKYISYIWQNGSWVTNNSNITTTSYTFSGLTSGTTYTLGFAGVNAAGTAGAVGQISAATDGSVTFSTVGNFTFTVPLGVTQLIAAVCGGGGGGGAGGTNSAWEGAGGGAGGAAFGVMNVTPGQQINGTVGSGGSGGFNPYTGSPGTSSTFGSWTGGGGNGGQGCYCVSSIGTGGAPGTVSGSGAMAIGGAGSQGSVSGIANGGYGGNSFFGTGGAGATSYCAAGNGGIGAGGGGGSYYNADGNGGNGQVEIWW